MFRTICESFGFYSSNAGVEADERPPTRRHQGSGNDRPEWKGKEQDELEQFWI